MTSKDILGNQLIYHKQIFAQMDPVSIKTTSIKTNYKTHKEMVKYP